MSDVHEKSLWLLQFIHDSLREDLVHPYTLTSCLEEAGCGLRILDKHVRSNDVLNSCYFLSPLNNFRFSDILAGKQHSKRVEATERALEFVATTRALFEAAAATIK